MKRFFALLICFLFAIFNTIVGFAVNDTDISKNIYETIQFDYCYVTGLSETEADSIFEQIQSDYDLEITEYIENKYPQLDSSKLENTILYLQDNYSDFVAKLSNDDKHKLDSYLLHLSIQYYEVNYDDLMLRENNVSANLEENIVISPADSRIQTEVAENSISRNGGYISMRIFSDPSESRVGSSGLSIDVGTHSWIVVYNDTGGNITVGKMSIENGTQIAIGTWGNKSEHVGVWYNLEPYLSKYSGAYTTNVSKLYNLSSSELSTLNNYINSHNSWSTTTNCSSFAVGAWNSVASKKLSAGIINTPKNLANSIIGTTVYTSNQGMRYYYKVHYANSVGTPVASSVFTRID